MSLPELRSINSTVLSRSLNRSRGIGLVPSTALLAQSKSTIVLSLASYLWQIHSSFGSRPGCSQYGNARASDPSLKISAPTITIFHRDFIGATL
jgi:hypothetical protein